MEMFYSSLSPSGEKPCLALWGQRKGMLRWCDLAVPFLAPLLAGCRGWRWHPLPLRLAAGTRQLPGCSQGRRRGVSCRPGLTPCPFLLLGVLVDSHTLTVGPVGVWGEHPQPLGTGHPALTRDHADDFCLPLMSLHH